MKFKLGIVICIVGLCIMFQMDKVYFENSAIKPVTSSNVSFVLYDPWSIRVSHTNDKVNLIAQSTNYFVLTEVDSNNKKHFHKAIDNDGLYLVDTEANLDSKYTSYYRDVYFSLDSPFSFTYDEERINPTSSFIFMIFINLLMLTILVLVLILCMPPEDKKSKT